MVGLDLNEAMLTVARRAVEEIEWGQGDAAALPFPDGSFDGASCQMALMFFPDRVGTHEEMGRVAEDRGAGGGPRARPAPRPGAFAPFVDLAARHAGPEDGRC